MVMHMDCVGFLMKVKLSGDKSNAYSHNSAGWSCNCWRRQASICRTRFQFSTVQGTCLTSSL